MDQEEKDMLKKTLELTQENNDMLRSIKRGMFWSKIIRSVYWIVVIGAAVGVYYYIQPYLDNAVNAYGSFKSDVKDFGNLLNIKK